MEMTTRSSIRVKALERRGSSGESRFAPEDRKAAKTPMADEGELMAEGSAGGIGRDFMERNLIKTAGIGKREKRLQRGFHHGEHGGHGGFLDEGRERNYSAVIAVSLCGKKTKAPPVSFTSWSPLGSVCGFPPRCGFTLEMADVFGAFDHPGIEELVTGQGGFLGMDQAFLHPMAERGMGLAGDWKHL
jgi:hypothetical protein